MDTLIKPTLYHAPGVGFPNLICEICGESKPCFSVLCSWPYKGEYLTGNKLACLDCLSLAALER